MLPPTPSADAQVPSPSRPEGDAAPVGGFRGWSARLRPAGPVTSRRMARLGAQGLVLALVAGGTTAFSVLHTTVTVDVDGTPVEVTAFARTVGDVLADAGIETGARDLVAPALDARVEDGGEIVVRHGRSLTVEVDGEARTVWTTALTVGEAMADLGLRGDDARVSASRSASLGRGEVLRVSTEKTVQVAVDGAVRDVATTAATVREALQEIDVVLQELDQVSVPLDAEVTDGLAVTVTRAVHETQVVVQELPFTETVVDDPTILVGERRVAVPGRAGQRQTTYDVVTVGAAEVSRSVVADIVLSEPVTQEIRIGTKPVPPPPPPPPAPAPARAAAPAPARAAAPAASAPARSAAPAGPVSVDPASAQGIAREMLAARGWGDDQFSCLVKLWTKESNWRVNADNPSSSAYGIPQALPGSKMASAGADWRTNPATQITWGLGYITSRYGTPCAAWSHSQARNWY